MTIVEPRNERESCELEETLVGLFCEKRGWPGATDRGALMRYQHLYLRFLYVGNYIVSLRGPRGFVCHLQPRSFQVDPEATLGRGHKHTLVSRFILDSL